MAARRRAAQRDGCQCDHDNSFAVDGGLFSYGPDQIDIFRRAAPYVDRILKGEKPARLLEIREKALGREHPLVARSLGELASRPSGIGTWQNTAHGAAWAANSASVQVRCARKDDQRDAIADPAGRDLLAEPHQKHGPSITCSRALP
jgi:hypothetical protein